jgi:hypothetical protein
VNSPRPAWFVLRLFVLCLKGSEVDRPAAVTVFFREDMLATRSESACGVSFRSLCNGKIFTLEANDLDPGSGTEP